MGVVGDIHWATLKTSAAVQLLQGNKTVCIVLHEMLNVLIAMASP